MSKATELIISNNNLKEKDDEIELESKQYNDLLTIYGLAMNQVVNTATNIKNRLNEIYNYNLIEKIDCRVKSKDSILRKMDKKDIPFTYQAMVKYVDDIAGVRIICPLQDDVLLVKEVIKNMPNIHVIQEKDYITTPKKSGYSAYHLIVETPLTINTETVIMKVEIQIRTVAMDFWAEMEHDIRYKNKTNKQLTKTESKKLTWYAKKLEKLQEKMVRLYRKQEDNTTMVNY